MNTEKTLPKEPEVLTFAITLTTGKDYKDRINIARDCSYVLTKIISPYSRYLEYYEFNMEVLDKCYCWTKLHYHGIVQIKIENIIHWPRFVSECEKNLGHVDIKTEPDDGWTKYIRKQLKINKHLMPKVKYQITPQNLDKVRKWAQPKEPPTGIELFMEKPKKTRKKKLK